MAKFQFIFMSLVAVVWGVLVMAEYVFVAYDMNAGWMEEYSEPQRAWLAAVPSWVHAVFGAWATLLLVGALFLVTRIQACVWMLGIAFLAQIVLSVWASVFADPTLVAMLGVQVWAVLALTLALTGLIYIYARGEKRRRSGVL